MEPWVMSALMLPLLLLPLGQAAPKEGAIRPAHEVQQRLLPNPFEPGPEQLRLLQNYLRGLEKMKGEEEPQDMSREQVLLYLFALHDYDQSGHLDGLELLFMLTAALAPRLADFPINPVILVVDRVLETQDLNGDGLLTPAELISFQERPPGHPELPEPRVLALQEPQATGKQALPAKSPRRQETHGAPGPGEEAGGQEEANQPGTEGDSPVSSVPEVRGPEVAEGPGSEGEARGQVEAGEDVPGPIQGAEEQAESKDNGGEAHELPGETLESKNSPHEFEVHSIQLENDEI
ncbi:cell growth regulator with EF hand domain protein 1 [Perognathus longimembris pacificus]|uniref:cell growth regulator with EF hand domain protein 1 n=1 Tax=Perognathus longimembris pacificus TaxID=214514 RepID=UPI002019469D|nr:cell growth regulator with EF hand domain protein 1 [Perognathus longimembris pacificus]XP_048209230.1 cell growth regulator with EF hand domain protein 1 [Perognathus longimembris pacificus]XP_048209231.1 cell growth regulator with EF hand domain protein 1 [Perognathus longimembris pacificus]